MFDNANKVAVNSLLFILLLVLLLLPVASVGLVSYSPRQVPGGVLSAQEEAPVIEVEEVVTDDEVMESTEEIEENEKEYVIYYP